MIAPLQKPRETATNRIGEFAPGGPEHRPAMELDRNGYRRRRPPVETIWRRMGLDELEIQIALMLQEGSSNGEIAQQLEISEEMAAHRTAQILATLCARRNGGSD